MLPGEAALSLTTSLCSPSCFSRSLMEKPSSSSSLSLVLLSLPSELLEQILLSSPLSVPDLCRVRSVCWHFKNVVDRLWTKVARSRWRGWGTIKGYTHQEWYNLCCQRYQCKCQVTSVLECLSHRCYKLNFTDEDEIEIFSTILQKKTFSSDILLCVLSDILQTPPVAANLTEQFYALYGKEYIIRQKLISEWKELLDLQLQEQTMEKGAVLIAQWMRPCHCPGTSNITQELDSIAERVAVHLVGSTTPEEGEVKRVRQSALARVKEEGDYSVDERLTALNSVLYDQLGYRGAGETYYELHNSLIDQVLERKMGIPLTLSVVYEAVARRLGVHLNPVNFPQHFVLQIPPERSVSTAHPDRCIVDAYFRGQRLTIAELNARTFRGPAPPKAAVAARPMEVYARFLNNISLLVNRMNIERVIHTPSGKWLPIPLLSFLYFRTALMPQQRHDISACIQLQYNPRQVLRVLETNTAQQFLHSDSHHIVTRRLQEMVDEREVIMGKALEAKKRPITANVKFSVGMVMKHKRYNYRCVIYGWDEKCVMSEEWIAQMNVDRHPPGRHQPFYNVLAHDGSNRYAAQANLMDCPSEEMGSIPHWEVGKYFTQFTGKKYIPSAPLKEVYPDDR